MTDERLFYPTQFITPFLIGYRLRSVTFNDSFEHQSYLVYIYLYIYDYWQQLKWRIKSNCIFIANHVCLFLFISWLDSRFITITWSSMLVELFGDQSFVISYRRIKTAIEDEKRRKNYIIVVFKSSQFYL